MQTKIDRDTTYAAILVVIVVSAAFGGALGNGFVYDDKQIVVDNPVLRTLDPSEHLGLAFWAGWESDYEYYRPATSWSLALDRALFGAGPRGFHLTNLLLHGLNALLLFQIVRGFGGSFIAGGAAALFAAHPLQTEAVVWVVGRTDLLATTFVLLAVLMHAELPDRPNLRALPLYASVVLLIFAALLAKEAAITFPALLVGTDAALSRSRGESWGIVARRLGQRFALLGPLYVAVIAGFLILRFSVVGQLAGGLEADDELWKNPLLTATPGVRLLTAVTIAGRYLHLVLFPRSLTVDYYFDVVPLVESAASLSLWVSFAALAAVVYLVIRLARQQPVVVFGALTVGGTYLLISHLLFPAPIVMAERGLYLPMAGIAAILAVALFMVAARFVSTRHLRRAGVVLVVLVLLPMVWRSHARTAEWKDELSLFVSATRAAPRSALAWNNLGAAQIERGDVGAALESFTRAAEISPSQVRARLNQARAQRTLGDLEASERLLRQTAADLPDQAEPIWLELTQLLARQAGEASARGVAEESRRLRLEAIEEAGSRASTASTPGAKATFHLVVAQNSALLGHYGRAERAFQAAVSAIREPASSSGRVRAPSRNLETLILDASASFFWRTKRPGEAAGYWLQAAEVARAEGRPRVGAEMMIKAGEALAAGGRTEEALKIFGEAETLADGDAKLVDQARRWISRLQG